MARPDGLILLLQEIGAEVRSRREPEHLFTAAAVGAMGAIAGGSGAVATVDALASVPFWQHPALLGAVSCVVICVAIVVKTERENRVYRAARSEQLRLYKLFAQEHGLLQSELPHGLRTTAQVGRGHWYSSAVVIAATLGATAFCLSVLASTYSSSGKHPAATGGTQPLLQPPHPPQSIAGASAPVSRPASATEFKHPSLR